jgi:hypothetical protein
MNYFLSPESLAVENVKLSLHFIMHNAMKSWLAVEE